MNITTSDIWQTLAIQVYIIGNQQKPTENVKNIAPLRKAITDAKNYLIGENMNKKGVVSDANARKLTTIINLCTYEAEIRSNFQKMILKLGDSVAGDEKLFHFTGESGLVRLVISKPDRVGLWFYELCCKLSNNKPYLLYSRLQKVDNPELETITCKEIVKDWCDIIDYTGNATNDCSNSPNKHTFLACDSYYMSSDSRSLLKDYDINYTASVSKHRFGPECNFIHDGVADEPGEHKTIYNDETKELLTYHYDTQKGVGKKYNLSRGLTLKTDKSALKKCDGIIPGYELYKQLFEVCDRFNRGLHDKSFPHKRGGKKTKGDLGCAHDFLFACILQNTFNVYDELNKNIEENSSDFKKKCCLLSQQMFDYSTV